jgi:hypothetical protein
LEREVERLHSTVDGASRQRLVLHPDPRELWAEADFGQRRELLRVIVEHVRVLPARRGARRPITCENRGPVVERRSPGRNRLNDCLVGQIGASACVKPASSPIAWHSATGGVGHCSAIRIGDSWRYPRTLTPHALRRGSGGPRSGTVRLVPLDAPIAEDRPSPCRPTMCRSSSEVARSQRHCRTSPDGEGPTAGPPRQWIGVARRWPPELGGSRSQSLVYLSSPRPSDLSGLRIPYRRPSQVEHVHEYAGRSRGRHVRPLGRRQAPPGSLCSQTPA